MRHSASLVLLCLGTVLLAPRLARAQDVPANGAEVSVYERANTLVARTETALKAGDLGNASASLRGLRAIIRVAPTGSIPTDLPQKAIRLRKEVARAGGVAEDWEMWAYDGLDPGPNANVIREVERAVAQYRVDVARTNIHAGHRDLINLKSRLGFEVFGKDPLLRYFRTEVAGPAIAGINQFHAAQITAQIADYIRLAQAAFAKHEMEQVITFVRMAHNYQSLLVAEDLADGSYQLKLESETLGLHEAMAKADVLVQQSQAYTAKATSEEEGRDKLWRSVVQGDKAKLYEEFGPPAMWDVTESEWSPEDAAKAQWWRYFEPIDAHRKRQITYSFDKDHKIVVIDKAEVYVPY